MSLWALVGGGRLVGKGELQPWLTANPSPLLEKKNSKCTSYLFLSQECHFHLWRIEHYFSLTFQVNNFTYISPDFHRNLMPWKQSATCPQSLAESLIFLIGTLRSIFLNSPPPSNYVPGESYPDLGVQWEMWSEIPDVTLGSWTHAFIESQKLSFRSSEKLLHDVPIKKCLPATLRLPKVDLSHVMSRKKAKKSRGHALCVHFPGHSFWFCYKY